MKDSKTASRPNDGFAVSRGFLGGSSVIQSNCRGAHRPMNHQPVPAEVA